MVMSAYHVDPSGGTIPCIICCITPSGSRLGWVVDYDKLCEVLLWVLQGGLSESQQTGSRDEPPASSSSSSSSSSLQQQQQAVTHVHYVFHGPVSHAQFGNSNVMQHTLDTQLVQCTDNSYYTQLAEYRMSRNKGTNILCRIQIID